MENVWLFDLKAPALTLVLTVLLVVPELLRFSGLEQTMGWTCTMLQTLTFIRAEQQLTWNTALIFVVFALWYHFPSFSNQTDEDTLFVFRETLKAEETNLNITLCCRQKIVKSCNFLTLVASMPSCISISVFSKHY